MKPVRRALALGAVMLATAAAAVVAVVPEPAQARTSVSVGIGLGFGPIFPGYGYYQPYRYYAPPPPVVQYYAPPPVVYAPPPPPPPVVQYYNPPPVAQYYNPPPAPIGVDPAGPVYYSRSGQQCREFQSRAMIGGRPQPIYGTACLQPDGSWRIVD